MAAASGHIWQFSRSGGFDQVRFETAQDFARLEELDLKLWAALACPVKGLEFDEQTLALIDEDHDGRVRVPEIIAAVQWCEEHLKDLMLLKAGADVVQLSHINETTASGQAILASARQILKGLGKGDATAISLADVEDTAALFAGTKYNGDGVVTAESVTDEAARKVLGDVLACLGPVADRSGRPGLDAGKLGAFYDECAAFAAWSARAASDAAILPLGEATAAACDAWEAVRAKVDDFFARCRLAAFDGRALAALNRREEEFLAIAAQDLSITVQEITGFPVARIEVARPLPLVDGINPAWSAAIGTLRTAAVEPLLGKGKTAISVEEWTALGGKLAAFAAWRGSRPATSVESLGLARVSEILAGKAKAAILEAIAADRAVEQEFHSIAQVERLVRYQRDLYQLLCNFVNFADFYSPTKAAIFQVGRLFLDARECELVVRVDDAAKHAALAGLSKAYLAYCDCTRPSGEKLSIAAAFTDGDSDYLMVGRNGVFYDRKGRDWDATITRVVENPISVRQAFWSPYKKLVRMIEELAAKRAAEKDAEADAKLASTASGTVNVDKAPPRKIDVGTVAAISVAIAGIGALATTVIGSLAGVFTLPFWQLCLVFGGILLVISGPSMIIAWLKLRQRNLGPILDANGWAVNGRVKLNVSFGASLTSVAKLPEGSVPGVDPYGDKPSPWPRLIKIVVVVWFLLSFANSQGWIWSLTQPGSAFQEAVGVTLGDRKLSAEEEAAVQARLDAEAAAAAAEPPVAPAR